MYSEFVLPAFLCVAGLIILADLVPIQGELHPDHDADFENEFAIEDDNRNAIQTKKGAATASTM